MTNTDVRFLAAVPALPVSDENRAGRFWTETFGFEQVEVDGQPIGIVRRDGVEVHLWVPDGIHKGAELHLIGSASCRIEVRGIDDLYNRCVELDVVHPNAPLADTSWGTREFGVLDLDGNLIGVVERLR